MIARAALVIAAGLLVGVQVVRNAAVAQFAETRPEAAARIWASHPSSELWLGLTEIGLNARRRAVVDPSTLDLIRDGARKAPLAPEPLLVRGVQAQLAGDQRTAEQAFFAARLRDGRSIPARYFLAEQYFRGGHAPQGLREIAVLARLVPNGVTNLAPYVAAFAKDPRNRTQLRSLFRSDPMLEQAALSALASDPRNSDLILGLATPTASTPQWSGVLLQSLAAAGQYADAYRVWTKVSHVAATPDRTIFDAGFQGSDAPPPFNWTLTSSTIGLAERQTGGRLHVIFYGQEDGVLASQLLLLRPGRYRLTMQMGGAASHAGSLSWRLSCPDSKAQLFSLPLSDAGRAAMGVTFDVPANCAAQYLELIGSAPELPQQSDVTVSGLSLTKGAPNG